MRQKFFRLLPLLMLVFCLTGCGYAGPEKAVEKELNLIRNLDEETIKAFVSYEDIHISSGESNDIGPETTEAVKLFFKNFKYRIIASALGSDTNTATVDLKITNLDAEQLAKDLCRSMIRRSFDYGTPVEGQNGLTSSFALMKEFLETNEYETKTTEATVHLTKQNDEWIIQESSELEDALTGGLVSCLNDPYLLTPDEVLAVTLEPFAGFSAEQWKNYLNVEDIFSIGSSLSQELDDLLLQRLAQFFDYQIGDVSLDENTAVAGLQVTSLDLASVMEQCRKELLDYAETTESIRASDEELTQKTAEILLAALKSNEQSAVHTVSVTLFNNGHTWEAILDDTFTDALLGGLSDALAILNEV